MAKVEIFTKGKTKDFNDDVGLNNDHAWVVCDGVTDSYNRQFDGRHSGELAARLTAEEVLAVELNGKPLVDHINKKLQELYRRINPEALTDPKARFMTTLVCGRITGKKLVVTQVADSGFRINGTDTYFDTKKIDDLTSQLRAHYIQLTGDIAGSRDFIVPIIREQLTYCNNPDHVLGYGAISGTPIPEKFIRVFEFDMSAVHTLELFSDGYYDQLSDEVSIAAYEAKREQIELEDPDKYKKYVSTKSNDDRTVMIVRF
jgi:serine/threonine protein phosphatase PrpC